jgi:hypothetical protein
MTAAHTVDLEPLDRLDAFSHLDEADLDAGDGAPAPPLRVRLEPLARLDAFAELDQVDARD